jgi:hypothetical protein
VELDSFSRKQGLSVAPMQQRKESIEIMRVQRRTRGTRHSVVQLAPRVVQTLVEDIHEGNAALPEGSSSSSSSSSGRGKTEPRGKGTPMGVEEKPQYWVSPIVGTSLFLFGPKNRIRLACAAITNHGHFEAFVMVAIFLSVVLLIIDTPGMDPDSDLALFIFVTDWVNTCVFTAEALMRIVSTGFVGNQHAYLRDWWNDLDFLIVIFSWMDKVFSGIAWVKAFRALRSLRPLRVVSRNESLMVVIQSIVRSIPGVMNVFVVSSVFFLSFGILGVNLFSGLFKRCETIDGDASDQFLFNREQCEAEIGMIWQNPDVANFDNIFYALLTLFSLFTMELWPDALYRSVDISSVDEAPIRDNMMVAALYWVVFVVVVNFFISNLFVGMIVDTFVRVKRYVEGSALLTNSQQKWLQVYRLMYHTSPSPVHRPRHAGCFRNWLFDIITHPNFETAVSVLICINVLVMAMYYYDASDEYKEALEIAGHVFGILFMLEMTIKILALHFMYLADGWNVFDMLIVVFAMFELVFFVAYKGNDETPMNITILRVARLLRMIHIIKSSKGLRKLVQTIILSIPSLVNIGGLILLLFVVYATAGMALFGNMTHREFLNEHANFDNFGFAMFTLFRCATGESWNGIMHDLMPRTPEVNCDSSIEGDCGSYFAIPYFVSFTFVGMFVMLNLLVAVLLDVSCLYCVLRLCCHPSVHLH